MRPLLSVLVACAVALPGGASAAGGGAAKGWSDVPTSHWARAAIDYVARQHEWMGGRGATAFRPDAPVTRAALATAVVRAFAPDAVPARALAFADLPGNDAAYPYAAVAVARGWMSTTPTGFAPTRAVTTTAVHEVIVRALGLRPAARALDRLSTADGARLAHPRRFGALNLGMVLGLRTNHRDESLEVGPQSRLPRAELAWSLYRAATVAPSRLASARTFADISLPTMTPAARGVIEFGLRWIGHPYVWGGQTPFPRSTDACCGSQLQGGFDCSGFVWWLYRARSAGYDPTPRRPYAGWALNGRTADQLARSNGRRVAWRNARPGDLLFYDGDDDGVIDHVDIALGNGWALDASASRGGVTVISVADGWHQAHFERGLRIP